MCTYHPWPVLSPFAYPLSLSILMNGVTWRVDGGRIVQANAGWLTKGFLAEAQFSHKRHMGVDGLTLRRTPFRGINLRICFQWTWLFTFLWWRDTVIGVSFIVWGVGMYRFNGMCTSCMHYLFHNVAFVSRVIGYMRVVFVVRNTVGIVHFSLLCTCNSSSLLWKGQGCSIPVILFYSCMDMYLWMISPTTFWFITN